VNRAPAAGHEPDSYVLSMKPTPVQAPEHADQWGSWRWFAAIVMSGRMAVVALLESFLVLFVNSPSCSDHGE